MVCLETLREIIFQKSFHTVIILLTIFQMNQNETLSWEFLISGMWKTHIWTNNISTADVPTVAFLYGRKVALKKILCGKAHCHDGNSTCSMKNLVS